ncbi:MAG: hypothetical protein KKI02_07455, partial [Planctomycetes bacterium]|nr:hypothetical protein [Planctomycetota bacterium]
MTHRLLSVIVALSLITAAASLARAQQADKAPPKSPPTSGHVEVQNDPYVPVEREAMRTGPGGRYIRNGYVAVQANVDAQGNNIIGDAANEPSIAVDPTDRRHMVIGWRQFDTIMSDFRQAGWGYTADGGRTWTFPGVIEPGVFRSDPVVDSDSQGNFYYNSLTTDAYWDFWCHVYRSADGGQTWDDGTYAWGGDKQWQTIDKSGGIGDGNIYAAWNLSYSTCDGLFTRSTNGGDSFESCTYVPANPYWGTLAVGPDGELYICGNGFTVAKSTTAQNPLQPVSWDFSTTVSLGGSIVFSAGPNPGGLLGQCWIDVDRSDGPTRGNVYLLCSVDPGGADPLDIMFSRSTDGGQSWSPAVRVNDDASTTAWQWFGTMSVAPNGRIDAIWLDTRADPGGYDSELYYSFSEDAGVTWSPNEVLTPPFDPHVGWPQQNKLGDYFDMTSDDMGADLAFATTLNGEQDVYYMRLGDICFDAGTVELDRTEYACESTATIQVNDCGLNTDNDLVETVEITIESDSELAGETVTLTETDIDTGLFEGSIPLSETDDPGVLLIAETDTVTATYIDGDDGEGGTNIVVTGTALVDCTAPIISNVQVTDVGPRDAYVTFETDEPTLGAVRYGTSCDALTESASQGGYDTLHSVHLTGLSDNATYFFAVDAEDEAGNPASDDNGGACYVFATPDIPDFYTESFESGGNDVDNLSLIFTPNAGYDFYNGCVEEIDELPTDPSGSTNIYLSDDDYEAITLGGGQTVSIYGNSHSTFYVGSNGYITFGSGDTDYSETVEDHFDLPRISALFDDLSPSSGSVSWKQLDDRAVVTFQNVPEYGMSNSNTFQFEMFFNGDITISYLGVDANDGLAGLSEGQGVDPDYYATDLSQMGSCGPQPPVAENGVASTPANTPVTIALIATDDGLPEPPTLVYIIEALPSHGTLSDPGAGEIESVPYLVGDEGNQVVYEPDDWYLGSDSFLFKANDGGTPPEGGDSNLAVIAIEVIPPDPELAVSFPLDSDPGWSTQGQWAFGQPTGGGSHNYDPTSGYTGNNVYGYNLAGDYSNNMPEYSLTTTTIDCSMLLESELRFWRRLGVERRPFDHAGIRISTDGSSWITLWENPSSTIADSEWIQVSLDIADIADREPTVYLRWTMGPTDGSTSYPGWNIDDVEIWAVVMTPPCPGDLDGDGDVDLSDLSQLLAHYGITSGATYEQGDLDGDGDVDLSDLSALLAVYGAECP